MRSATGGALLFIASLVSSVSGDQITSFTCQPGQPCWPSLAEWQAFNQTVSGRLRVTTMLGSPCFPSSPNFNDTDCAAVRQKYTDPTFRQSIYGALEMTEWEACGSANCYPGVFVPQGQTCSLGRLSALYVDAVVPSDITLTLQFVKKHGIRIVVKNTGHDYQGRSVAPNTLAIRVNGIKNMAYQSSFTAYNCPASGRQNIGVIGAGVTAEEAYTYFASYGMMVTTGGCSSVGIAGGYGQGGGHGPLAPTVGLMVDQAVEFDVVTMDGVFRTINKCNEPDLFWAMRGGGAQSFAILINYKFQLHPSTPWATWRLEATLDPGVDDTKNAVLRDVLTTLSNQQIQWSQSRIAGYNSASLTTISLMEMLPGAGDPLTTLKGLTASFHDFMTSHPGVNITLNTYSQWTDQLNFYTGNSEYWTHNGGVGVSVLGISRLITKDNFETAPKVDTLVTSVINAMETVVQRIGPQLAKQVPFLILKSVPFNTPDAAQETSVNPAWRSTLWHLSPAAIWLPGTPDATTQQILGAARAALNVLKSPLAIQAAYQNEADPEEPDWQNVFFGEPYSKLLEIKKKCDPETVLNCRKCVGYVGPQDPMYSCDGDNPTPSTPYPFA